MTKRPDRYMSVAQWMFPQPHEDVSKPSKELTSPERVYILQSLKYAKGYFIYKANRLS
jgi:hypothetical protein